jgi:hypothetical protein
LWLSLVRSQRWVDLARDPRAAVVIDAGTEFHALRGVEIVGECDLEPPASAQPSTAAMSGLPGVAGKSG